MFNDKQKKAISEPLGKNILVSAAAGSGKTRVLVERTVALLGEKTSDNKDISLANMVIMTFTKKATQELKKRIKEAIELRLISEPENKMLIKESALLSSANISTIDSFCKKILEEHYDKLSVGNSVYGNFDPAYRIADEKELNILYNDVLNDFLEEKYAEEKYKPFFDAYMEKCDESNIKNILLKGIKFLSSITWPDEYLLDRLNNFEKECIDNANKYINSKIDQLKMISINSKSLLDDLYDVMEESKNNLSANGKIKGATYKEVCNILDKTISELENLFSILSKMTYKKEDVMEALDAFDKIVVPSFPRKNLVMVSDEDEYRLIADNVEILFKDLSKIRDISVMLDLKKEIICNENEKLLLELLYDFYMKIIEEKKHKNIYAIGDYANLALDILYDKVVDDDGNIKRVPSDTAKILSDKYTTIFVDEYQDTNYIQEYILYAITDGFKKKNTFLVGDVKQSIYGFRNAKPEIFNEKFKTYKDSPDDNMLITLDANYRSRKPILQYVNELFTNVMHEEYGAVNYERDGKLGIPNEKTYVEPPKMGHDLVEIFLLSKNQQGVIDIADDEKIDNIAYEAEFVAKKIYELVNDGVCKYKDIAILLRSTKGKAEYFLDAFSKYGIPGYSELNRGFFNRFEIKLLISILRIIDNPLQNIELASVITSSIFDIKNKELAFLKIAYQEAIKFGKGEQFVLYDAIKYFIDNYEAVKLKYKDLKVDVDALKDKLTRFINILNELTFKARYLSISELIDCIYEMTDVCNIVGSMTDGKMRIANLDILYQNAKSYENSSYVGLFNFLRYIEKIIEREDDQGQARLLDENDDVVHIMTIHSSKGLEFPIVFLSNVGNSYNYNDTKDICYFDKDYGVALSYIDKEKRYNYPTPKVKLLKELIIDKTNTEEMRMLYVALTRAKSKLYITSYVRDAKPIFQTMTDYDIEKVRKANSFLKLMMLKYKDNSFCALNYDVMDTCIDNTPIVAYEKKSEVKDDIQEFIYKYDYLKKVSPKFSVTSIKQLSKSSVNIYEDFDAEEKKERTDGTLVGTAYHRYMQFYDYNINKYNCPYEDMSKKECCINYVKKEKIDAFLDTVVGRKMAEAYRNNTLYREHKFMKLFSQDEINEYIGTSDAKCDEKNVIIQGIIDAFLIEKDKDGNESIVLIDYKTDKINIDNVVDKDALRNYLIKNYKVQLDIYGRILNELTGLPVNEKYIYSFALDEAIML